jgi:hypothetical protein
LKRRMLRGLKISVVVGLTLVDILKS